MLETLGEVYYNRCDGARAERCRAEERLRFIREHSGPVMERAAAWLEAQLAEKKSGAELGSGQSDHLSVAALEGLTAFLRASGRAAG